MGCRVGDHSRALRLHFETIVALHLRRDATITDYRFRHLILLKKSTAEMFPKCFRKRGTHPGNTAVKI